MLSNYTYIMSVIGMNKLFIGFLVLAVAALGIAVSTTATEFSTANI
jgi:hypothetical protein